MANVQLEGVTKRFGEVVAVDRVDLHVADGEFLVLIGPSGSGKTSILRMISGLDDPTEGTIRIGGAPVSGLAPKDRNVAMVFQNYALYPHMTVYENMAFGLRTRRMPKAEIDIRVREAAEMLSITSLLGRKPRQLSGGEKQRVALGRAIVRRPGVFLMDEPLSNLDAPLRVQTRAELIRLHRSLNITTIYVTHDQVEAMSMGQRIVVLNQGKVQQIGSPWETYDSPVNAFTAKFIGIPAINLILLTAESTGNGLILTSDGEALGPARDLISETECLIPGRKILLGFRPEHVVLSERAGNRPALHGEVELVEIVGADTYVTIKLKSFSAIARVNSQTRPTIGDRVSFTFTKALLFDPDTGQRKGDEAALTYAAMQRRLDDLLKQ